MASIRPFAAIRYARSADISTCIAPPYDVLDERGKASLLARNADNIVAADLPHLPAKTVGPDAAYAGAAAKLSRWLANGILAQDKRHAIYLYQQTYHHGDRTFHRKGLFALVKLSPFGEGYVVPHEQTYESAIEDRLKLTRATGTQLSPIFGLFSDPRNEITSLLYKNVGRPLQHGLLDGVTNDLWSITDADLENQVIDFLGHKPIYIADGHHRYTMALQYKKELEAAGGPLAPNHPANYCMFALVGLQDPGLIILPTHRLIGNLSNFSIPAFIAAVADQLEVIEQMTSPDNLAQAAATLAREPIHTFGLFDGTAHRYYLLRIKNPDILESLAPAYSEEWRRLDVAILQRYLIDEVFAKKFAGPTPLLKGYTAYADEIPQQVDGNRYQLGLLVRPTPLHALEQLGKTGEVMPQKSTFFYPKLATGMTLYSLKP